MVSYGGKNRKNKTQATTQELYQYLQARLGVMGLGQILVFQWFKLCLKQNCLEEGSDEDPDEDVAQSTLVLFVISVLEEPRGPEHQLHSQTMSWGAQMFPSSDGHRCGCRWGHRGQ